MILNLFRVFRKVDNAMIPFVSSQNSPVVQGPRSFSRGPQHGEDTKVRAAGVGTTG